MTDNIERAVAMQDAEVSAFIRAMCAALQASMKLNNEMLEKLLVSYRIDGQSLPMDLLNAKYELEQTVKRLIGGEAGR